MKDLYQEELMDMFKNPHNRGAMDDPSVSISKKNPMCGDELTLQLDIKDGVIKNAKFDGIACSVTIISSSILTDYLIGKTVEEVKKLSKDDLLKLINLNLTTSRVGCATLIFFALQDAIKNYEKRN
jgi:nitrogen fixation protein NifU and related proteins